ncbi:Homeobox-leucine zipper protein [Actinidia chinensis var. chinensis]|uniref:Homeobox-leucine zipper protein n=1 Tax=Actinidia chinensis var. chinensis TaxID=1590841 RepID=A0A2R6P9C1_ACTCC|nr:Homeobox-leucine zipper protein [Actinidia chinensis var. chinensis]
MDSGRLFFDPSRYGNMFFGNSDPIFRGPRSVMGLQEPLKRRTFFTSPDEVFDEEYYDEQLPEKKRRLTPEQVHLLEQSFEEENKLEPERKTQLAKKVGLQPRQVAVWFQNHRARWKTKHLEREYDCLKSSYESLLSECDSIHKENEKLKAEVVSLTEKVQAKEVAGAKSDSVPEDVPILSPLQLNVKAEDRLCSGGSAVVDEDGPQLMDSGDSYFLNDNYPGCMGPVDSLQSEEDDGSGDGQSFFSCALAAAEQQLHGEGEPLGWWVWSLNN